MINIKNSSETFEHIKDPQTGDLYCERLSFWVFVLERTENEVKILTGNSHNRTKRSIMTIEDFIERFTYDTMRDKCWVSLYSQNNDFSKMLNQFETYPQEITPKMKIQAEEKLKIIAVDIFNYAYNTHKIKYINKEQMINNIHRLLIENNE